MSRASQVQLASLIFMLWTLPAVGQEEKTELPATAGVSVPEGKITPVEVETQPQPTRGKWDTPLRFAGWIIVGFFGAGGLGAYLRRRPTGFLVVILWCWIAYGFYGAWIEGITLWPPLVALIMSIVLAPVAKQAADEARAAGRLAEPPIEFTSTLSLSMAYNLILVGLWVSMWSGWSAWEIIPGYAGMDFSRKLTIGALLLTGIPLMMWADTIAQGGLRTLRGVPLMAIIFLKCRRGWFLLGTLVFCVGFWYSPLQKEPQPLRWEMSVSLVISMALLWLQPPFALMLGESSALTGNALGKVANALHPFRVVALLDQSRTPMPFLKTYSWLTDDLRTRNENDWRWIVDGLIYIVPLIVLDARSEREVVIYETTRILDAPSRLQRTVFLILPDNRAPALWLNGVEHLLPQLKSLKESEIEERLAYGNVTGFGAQA